MQVTTWIDISELKGWNGHFTGIQRVVFNLGKELKKEDNLNVRFCRYDYRRKQFIPTDYSFAEPTYQKTTGGKVQRSFAQKVSGRLKTYLPAPVKKSLKRVISFSTPPYISLQNSVAFRDGDTLLIAGAFWTGQLKAVKKLEQKVSVKVVGVLYDMVPVITPHLCTRVTEIDFNRDIKEAVKLVDTWICISENTRQDLFDFVRTKRLKMKAKETIVIKLGSDIDTHGAVLSPFTKRNQPEEFLLFVSTIEARKNQQLIYQAVKLAEQRGIELPPFVLAGKHGWHSDDIISIIRRDTSVRKRILWLDNVDDRGLRWLYKNCLFTVYPSLYEGWGLPVAESLVYGKFSIASNNSSIPEIAGDKIDYFSPYSASDFLEVISKYLNDRSLLKEKTKRIKDLTQPRWSEIADQISAVL